jgi:hypothetical protein
MKRFISKLATLPVLVYAASILSAVAWCVLLGIIDNETPDTATLLQRYLDPMALLWYGLPVGLCILCFTIAVQERGYRPVQALKWSIPLGCLCGTVFALLVFGILYGWMKLTGTA